MKLYKALTNLLCYPKTDETILKIKKERFRVDDSLGWKLIFLAIFVIGGTGYSFYIVNSAPYPATAALMKIEPTKLAFEGYLIAIMAAMLYLMIIGIYIVVENQKEPEKSDSTSLNS